VILDSDHSQSHVKKELDAYHSMVTPGSYVLVQDGITDTLPGAAPWRPGPLPAIEEFLAHTPSFQVDEALCSKFPISHHPKGWLKRIA
jgi:cephalosporin hydroxylase